MSINTKNKNTKKEVTNQNLFSVDEVCDIVGVQSHVLRYWESEFPQFAPQISQTGYRQYSQQDIDIALRIKELLYEEFFTIVGAKKKLQSEILESPILGLIDSQDKLSSNLTDTEIKKRLEILEAEVALLKSKTEKNSKADIPWYKQIPKFGGNPAYEEASRLGREYRESQKDFEDEK